MGTIDIPVYLIIFTLAQFFQIILAWDALANQNTIQILGFVFFNVCATVYAIFQCVTLTNTINASTSPNKDLLAQTGEDVVPNLTFSPSDKSRILTLLLVIPIVMAVFAAVFCFLAYYLYMEFGWKIYKKIGADPSMRNMFRVYQIFLMLLKLDVFFVFGFGIQFLVLIIQPNDPEFALTIAAIPVMMLFLALAIYGVRTENKWLMWSFMAGLVLGISYFCFKLFRIYTQTEKYQFTKRYLTFFGTLAVALWCYKNFGRGLKDHISAPQDEPKEQEQPQMQQV
ncbi:hypothetical protein HDV05_000534 [Chytridiales sp. JEL 0842]|nr:hypothetical protein HDV05_000534 [Chytridiales sp. JEL 0842]